MDPEETPSLITTTSWSAAVLAVVYRPTGSPRVPLRTFRCGDGQGRPTASPALFAWRPTSPANSMSASRIAIIWVTRCLIAAGDQDPLWDYRQLTSRRKGGARTSVFNAVMLLAGDPPLQFLFGGRQGNHDFAGLENRRPREIARQTPGARSQQRSAGMSLLAASQLGDLRLPALRERLGQRVASPFTREDRDCRNPPRRKLG
jgi:hypothetical protein